MKTAKMIALDHENEKIIINHAYAKSASVIGSKEYADLLIARNDTGYKVEIRTIQKKANQKRYLGLNYEAMKKCVAHFYGETSVIYFQLCEIIKTAKLARGGYGTVKKWFLNNCKECLSYDFLEKYIAEKATALSLDHAEDDSVFDVAV